MDVIRKLVINFPLYENDIIVYVCDYLCGEKFLYHNSIENYVTKIEPTFTRKFYFHLYNMVLISFLLKYSLFIIFPDEIIKIQFGEIIFIWIPKEFIKVYIFIVLFSLFAIMLKLMIFYVELNYKLKALKILGNLAKRLPFYTLNNNKQDTLILLTNILFWSLRIISMLWGLYIVITMLNISLYIYFFLEYDFNIIILLFNVIHAYLLYKFIMVIFTGGLVLIFIMIIFLNFKLDEIIKLIRLCVLWRNKVRLLDNMMTYNRFTKLVHEISNPINYCFWYYVPNISFTIINNFYGTHE